MFPSLRVTPVSAPKRFLFAMGVTLCLGVSLGGCAITPSVAAPAANVSVAVSQLPQLNTFNKLLQQSGLNATLAAPGAFTVFAPTDEAFKEVPAATLDQLNKDPAALKALISYHLVGSTVKSSDITGATTLSTLNGAKLAVSKAGDFVTVDDGLVTQPDLPSGNGVVHVIDRVLTPPPAKK